MLTAAMQKEDEEETPIKLHRSDYDDRYHEHMSQ